MKKGKLKHKDSAVETLYQTSGSMLQNSCLLKEKTTYMREYFLFGHF